MKKETADRLFKSSGGLDIHDDYSGRCMYGEKTHAVSGDSEVYMDAIMDVVEEMVDDIYGEMPYWEEFRTREELNDWIDDACKETSAKVRKFLQETLNARTDNLGFDTIWY